MVKLQTFRGPKYLPVPLAEVLEIQFSDTLVSNIKITYLQCDTWCWGEWSGRGEKKPKKILIKIKYWFHA